MMALTQTTLDNADENYLYQCPASYYNPVVYKWQDGTFTLHRNCLEFMALTPQHDTPFHLSIPFQMISAFKKRNSSLIFASLVIEVGCETHWFSSFPSRDSVYNLLELFQRNTLFAAPRTSNITDGLKLRTTSPLGKKLLGILHESEETLVTTAKMLDDQSQQLEEVEQDVDELNSNLTKAEKILKALPSRAMPSPVVSNEMNAGSETKTAPHKERRKKYKITFTDSKIVPENTNEWEKGFLLVDDGFKLLDEEENLRHDIPNAELSSILVVSPWELWIKQEEKNVTFNIMCPMLSHLHKVISSNQSLKDKIFYKEECESAFRSNSSFSSTSSESGSVPSPTKSDKDVEILTAQVQEYSESLTDEELHEISKALGNLQTLASEVNKERESQLDKIKQLIDDTGKTEVRLNANNKCMRKLM